MPLEGEYTAGKIAFAITVPQDAGPMNIGFAGSLKDDGTLSGTATGPFGEVAWKAVRSKQLKTRNWKLTTEFAVLSSQLQSF